jgi:L-ascorbate metabolism protein UlaG (beta-lactamase superfamily)
MPACSTSSTKTRSRASSLVAVVGLGLAGCAAVVPERVARSPEWHHGHFENPPSWPRRYGVAGLLKWRLTPGAGRVDEEFHPPFVANDGAELRNNHGAVSITWIGHATTLLQGGGANILTDPIWSDTLSGFSHRVVPPGLAGKDLPPIDVVLISHNHRDHLDEPTIEAIGPGPTYVVPLGLGDWFRKRGMTKVVELDWWETTEVVAANGARVVVSFVPAQHWSQRGVTDTDKSLWGGFVVDAGGRRFYFAGDTGYPAAFAEIGRRFPGLDYAILPIGAYAPRWFMAPQHMDPEEAARAFHELGARALVPVHWGTFHLSDEPMSEPPRRLRKAMGGDANLILDLAIGETWFEPQRAPGEDKPPLDVDPPLDEPTQSPPQ